MILFQNMKISVKLFIGFFIMILFMAGIGIGGYIGIKTIAHHSDDIFANRMPGVSYLLQTDRDLQKLLVAERSMIFANPKSSVFKSMVNAYEENLKQIEIRWEEYKSLDLSEKEKALIPRYEAAHREWKAISTQIVDGRKADTRKGRRLALDLTLGNAKEKFEVMRGVLDELTELNLALATAGHDEAVDIFRRAVGIILGFSLIGLVAGILLMGVISRGVTRPLNLVVAGLSDISQGDGDLTKRLEVSGKDEVGILAGAFNRFMEKLQAMVLDISENLIRLSEASESLLAVSVDMSSGSRQTSEQANTVAAAANEMSGNMTTVSAAVGQSSTNTATVSEAAEEMNSTITKIAGNAEQARAISGEAVSKVSHVTEKMDELGQAAHAIDKAVETITEISEQVNLLSLNATIEAARAGDAGKGFAVVANEIKDLAAQTSAASLDIKEKIGNIQESSKGTLGGINDIRRVSIQVNEIVSTIATAVEKQSSTTLNISENISQISTGLEEVNNNVGQSTVAAGGITEEINRVRESSDHMAEQGAAVKTSAEELSLIARQLDELVGSFKV
ncbi:MAG: methyl-accepting chemotaxis protein [Desulfobacterales bacterium]|nr:methyl-accepting chemotaxis protein [Desulfobacterales bacterium]